MKTPKGSEKVKMQDSSHVNGGIGEGHKTTATDLKSAEDKEVSGFSNGCSWTQTSLIEEKCTDISNTTQDENHQKLITSAITASDLNDLASVVDTKVMFL